MHGLRAVSPDGPQPDASGWTRAVVGSAVSEAVADEPVQTDALLGGGEG